MSGVSNSVLVKKSTSACYNRVSREKALKAQTTHESITRRSSSRLRTRRFSFGSISGGAGIVHV